MRRSVIFILVLLEAMAPCLFSVRTCMYTFLPLAIRMRTFEISEELLFGRWADGSRGAQQRERSDDGKVIKGAREESAELICTTPKKGTSWDNNRRQPGS
jgi:hypothetical protein